jgi:hypothetical protein
VPLVTLQPSQLFISARKLARVERRRPTIADTEPIPIKRLGRSIVMTDGHTRAVAAVRAGLKRVPVYWEDEELSWDMYRVCVRWCRRAGIRTPVALAQRIVPHSDYERLWYERCSRMQERIGCVPGKRPGGRKRVVE